MNDFGRTKQELIAELVLLRHTGEELSSGSSSHDANGTLKSLQASEVKPTESIFGASSTRVVLPPEVCTIELRRIGLLDRFGKRQYHTPC